VKEGLDLPAELPLTVVKFSDLVPEQPMRDRRYRHGNYYKQSEFPVVYEKHYRNGGEYQHLLDDVGKFARHEVLDRSGVPCHALHQIAGCAVRYA